MPAADRVPVGTLIFLFASGATTRYTTLIDFQGAY